MSGGAIGNLFSGGGSGSNRPDNGGNDRPQSEGSFDRNERVPGEKAPEETIKPLEVAPFSVETAQSQLDAAAAEQRKARGRASTILTGGLGLGLGGKANTARRTLLGN